MKIEIPTQIIKAPMKATSPWPASDSLGSQVLLTPQKVALLDPRTTQLEVSELMLGGLGGYKECNVVLILTEILESTNKLQKAMYI